MQLPRFCSRQILVKVVPGCRSGVIGDGDVKGVAGGGPVAHQGGAGNGRGAGGLEGGGGQGGLRRGGGLRGLGRQAGLGRLQRQGRQVLGQVGRDRLVSLGDVDLRRRALAGPAACRGQNEQAAGCQQGCPGSP